MLNLSNGVYFDISIGELSDFLNMGDLILFTITEQAGCTLPTFTLNFKTNLVEVKNKILENNPIIVRAGINKNKLDVFTLYLYKPEIKMASNMDSYYLSLTGTIFDKSFLFNKVSSATKGTPLDIIENVSYKYFKYFTYDVSEEKNSECNQNWVQTNESDRDLMYDAWIHLNLQPSFPLMAITKNGEVILKDFDTLKASTPAYTFTQREPKDNTEYIFLNSFEPKNYTEAYNRHVGYGKVVNILDTKTGNYNVQLSENEPAISATKEVETSNAGIRYLNGFYNTPNVHENYHESYFYNTAKILQLSNIVAKVELRGLYTNSIKVLDYVNVILSDSDKQSTESGRYIVDTIVYSFSSFGTASMEVYICRDSQNNIENNVVEVNNAISVSNVSKKKSLITIQNTRRTLALLRTFMVGSLSNEFLNYFSNYKNNILRSFAINNTTIDLTTQISSINSLKSVTYNIYRKLIASIIPPQYLNLVYSMGLNDNILQNSYFTQLIEEHAPSGSSSLYLELISTLVILENNLESVSNIADTAYKYEIGENIMLEQSNSQVSTRIINITDTLLNNVEGLDIPIPNIELTESQQLYTTELLTDYIAEQITLNLENLGYLKGVQNFKEILLGNTPLDSNTINIINLNIGSRLYTRFWGSFNDLSELTDYNIKKSYREEFKTVNCTKIIDARSGKRIFLAIPAFIKAPTFSVNSESYTMEFTVMDIMYFDSYNNNILYTVYYSNTYYNSNSVLLECRG